MVCQDELGSRWECEHAGHLRASVTRGKKVTVTIETASEAKALARVLGLGWAAAPDYKRARALEPLRASGLTTVRALVLPEPKGRGPPAPPAVNKRRVPKRASAPTSLAESDAEDDYEDEEDGAVATRRRPAPFLARLVFFDDPGMVHIHVQPESGSWDAMNARGAFAY